MEIVFFDFLVCNIVIMIVIWYLEGSLRFKFVWELFVELKLVKMLDFKVESIVKLKELLEDLLMKDMVLGLIKGLEWKVNFDFESVWRWIKEFEDVIKEFRNWEKIIWELENE